jgi:prophage regulatory protein
MSVHSHPSLEILRRREVEARTGLSRSTIYQRIREKSFPLPISLGNKSVGWIRSEVDDWIAERVKLSRPANSTSKAADGTQC